MPLRGSQIAQEWPSLIFGTLWNLDGEMALSGALRRFMNGRPEAACMSSRKKFNHSSSTGTLKANANRITVSYCQNCRIS
jgi:hypothetical protein